MTVELPRVAVVILCWNGRKFLEQFLPPLLQTTYPNVRYYVADNASTDDSVSYVKENFPEVRLIKSKKNKGFSEGYNIALKQIKADYYVLLNQDVEVTPGWIEPIIEMMENDTDIGAAQPKLRAFYDKSSFEYAGAAGGFIDKWGYTFCRGRIFDQVEKDKGQYDTVKEVCWASGAALFIRSELYHKAGGLDPRFFAHMEEIDLCWRLKNAGYKIMYCPGSVVYHVGGGSLPQGNPRKTYLNFRNNLSMLVKNLPTSKLFTYLPIRILLDITAAYRSLMGGNFRDYITILKAHIYFAINLIPMLYRRRCANKNIRSIYVGPRNQVGFYKKSIVMDFFFGKKKKFSELNRGDFY